MAKAPKEENLAQDANLAEAIEGATATPAPTSSRQFCDIQRTETGLAFTFSDGTLEEFDIMALPEEQRMNLLFHGAKDKLRDSFSGAKGNVQEALGSLRKVYDNLTDNRWTASRAGTSEGPRTLELVEAISRVKDKPIEAVAQIVEAATDEQIKLWRANKLVKAAIAEIRHEKAKKAAAAATAADDFEL